MNQWMELAERVLDGGEVTEKEALSILECPDDDVLLIWYRIDQKWAAYFERRQTFLQKPSWKGIVFRVKEVLQQFIFQAMPIFLIICLAATVLNELGVIRLVTLLVSPVLSLFGAPEDAAPGLVFSLIRKDGILLFNEGNGAL